jgi:alpha-ketoglutarate-dependent 2,4-dichlorophenoxyacetate dioxygenase
MSITVKPVTPDFVAEISGLDLAQPLKPADRDAVEAVINRYAIVVFHDQTLTDDQQIAFARHFGPIASPAQKARHTGVKHRIASNDIADISNLDGDGNVLEANSKRRLDWLGNRLWHTDASFRAVPGALSMLYAHVVPDEGGETEFADLRAAYDALPKKTQDQVETLSPNTRFFIRAASSPSPATRPRSWPVCRRYRSALCARIRVRAARRSTLPPTPRTSSACRSPMAGCC